MRCQIVWTYSSFHNSRALMIWTKSFDDFPPCHHWTSPSCNISLGLPLPLLPLFPVVMLFVMSLPLSSLYGYRTVCLWFIVAYNVLPSLVSSMQMLAAQSAQVFATFISETTSCLPPKFFLVCLSLDTTQRHESKFNRS